MIIGGRITGGWMIGALTIEKIARAPDIISSKLAFEPFLELALRGRAQLARNRLAILEQHH